MDVWTVDHAREDKLVADRHGADSDFILHLRDGELVVDIQFRRSCSPMRSAPTKKTPIPSTASMTMPVDRRSSSSWP